MNRYNNPNTTINDLYDLIRGKKTLQQVVKSEKTNEKKKSKKIKQLIKASTKPIEIYEGNEINKKSKSLLESKKKKSNIYEAGKYPQFESEYDKYRFQSMMGSWRMPDKVAEA